MKRLIATLILIPTLASAGLSSDTPPGQWQCLAFDTKEQSYSGFGQNADDAMRQAGAKCRQYSTLPKSCKTADSFCEQGPLSLNEQECLVTDGNGHSWNTTGVDPCKTAMELCNQFQLLQSQAGQCNVKHR